MNAEKWHHSEKRSAINDESQRSIAKNLRCDELLYYTFIIHSAGEIFFLNWWTFGEVTGKIADCVIYPICLAVLSSKMQISPDKLNNLCITDKNCYWALYMWTGRLMWVNFQEISNWCRPLLTYWQTDAVSDWLTDCSTRGNKYKLFNCTFCHNLRKYYFSARVINIWNSLPNCVVDVSTINHLKARLDKFWLHQDILYDYTAGLTGIGDRSVHVTKDE